MTAPKGIDVPFRFDDVNGSPASVEGVATLDRSIRTILLTTPGERVYRPEFGSWLRTLVFANMSTGTAFQAKAEVERALRQFEPRIEVIDVLFELVGDNRVELTINWRPNGRDLDATTTIEFVT